MSCCGSKRQNWQQEITPQKLAEPPILQNPITIGYNGMQSKLVTGPTTGYIYLFAELEPGLKVDGRDSDFVLELSEDFFKTETKDQD